MEFPQRESGSLKVSREKKEKEEVEQRNVSSEGRGQKAFTESPEGNPRAPYKPAPRIVESNR